MNKLTMPADAARMVFRLARGEFKRPQYTQRDLSPLEVYLREYQANRLAQTHADFLDSPTFAQAARFFLTDVYAAKDFSQRDAELEALYEFMRPVLPAEAVASLSNAVRLNDLTNRLDADLMEALREFGVTEQFTPDEYAAAYREGDYNARVEQIDLVVLVMREVAQLHTMPFVGAALKASRGAARRLGWEELHDFLTRGYDAWRGVRDPEPFLAAVERRETLENNRLFGRG
jgi:hypothetical protein